ncbi:DJ-1/PfpI family protein [Ktedonosporobacter rubrisoli]|uniref:DJ-1/PfpI family protein n=1 Tax=Ktedonosporobacter rubrisoli TaxID=2509675 RepID=A0A4P6JJH5_KTERU|nr:DJ-1/PfpI family protein [Ktedonosporobacter rubrisoli]QBD75264.1 DJ-1/PfpI family protein [Ktedonosporobacter rubrisoli]
MKKVLLLLANGFEAYEGAVFTDVMGFARNGGLEVDLTSTALHKSLTCAFGFSVIPHSLLAEISPSDYDALAVPGGTSQSGFYKDASREEFLATIREFNRANKPLAAICTGGIPIAQSGVLQGRHGTTFPGKRQQEMAAHGVNVLSQDIVVDKNIITSSSPKTGIEVAFTLLAMLFPQRDLAGIRSFFQ